MNVRESESPDEQECRITRWTEAGESPLDLRVRVTPLDLEGERCTMFAMQDTTDEKRREALEQVFFHDVLNAAGTLRGMLQEWTHAAGPEAEEIGVRALELGARLTEEICAQRDLAAAERGDLPVDLTEFDAAPLLEQLRAQYGRHPAARERSIAAPTLSGPTRIRTDRVLLGRVLGNLLKNALEASREGEAVTIAYAGEPRPSFSVHNRAAMPLDVRLQVFQRSFSTKAARGRGIGTYSVKLLTEAYLGGTVEFQTSEAEGTTFTVRLPSVVP